jgi:hypothetical protein
LWSGGFGPRNEGFPEWAGTASCSTGCNMPGQALPPESFGPWAIAGERLIAAARAKVVAQQHRAFISDLPSDNGRRVRPLNKLPLQKLIIGMAPSIAPPSRAAVGSGAINNLQISERCVSRFTRPPTYVAAASDETGRDHSRNRQVEALWRTSARFLSLSADGGEREALFEEMKTKLLAHAHAEQEVLYRPLARQAKARRRGGSPSKAPTSIRSSKSSCKNSPPRTTIEPLARISHTG